MKNNLFGILVCLLLFFSALSVKGTINVYEGQLKNYPCQLPSLHDVGVKEIISPIGCIYPGVHDVEAIIKNFGDYPEFDIVVNATIYDPNQNIIYYYCRTL